MTMMTLRMVMSTGAMIAMMAVAATSAMGLMEEKLLLTPRGCLPDPIVRPQCQEGDVGGPSEGTFREASELLQVSLVEGFPKE